MKKIKIKKIFYSIINNPNLILFLLILLTFYRIYNNWHFNPYWGYDGGEHIDYLFSLIKNNQIPSILENTVAWHEPLYYLLLWPLGKILYLIFNSELVLLKFFGVIQALLSVLNTYLIYKILKLITKSKSLIIILTTFLSFLPAFNQASTFLTNEILNYFFILLIIFYFLNNFIINKPNKYNYILLGLICGLSLLTKITALIIILSILIYFLLQLAKNKKINFKYLFVFLVLIIIINIPWFIYKNKHISPGFTINNQHFLEEKAIKLDERINFFLKFDFDIFIFPYWYSGGTAFWSMLYADSFYDYYGSIENKDYINYLLKNDPDKLVRTTHAPSYVTKKSKNLANLIIYLSPLLAIIIILGLGFLIFSFLKTKRNDYFFYSTISLGFLAALLFFAYRYPYYDYGIVKSIFIFPFYIFPVWGFFEMIKNKTTICKIFKVIIILYIIISIRYYFIVNFGY